MRVAVEEGEEHAERLLYPKDAEERPFAVELLDLLALEDVRLGDAALAGVVAIAWAGPEESAEVEGEGGGGGEEALVLDTCLRV